MKIEFPVLESEPLIYFLLHSGVFVLALACVFFILGLWMGAAIWGRYKKQLNNARVEIAGQFQEIAVLKRKLAEQTMRPSSGPLQPPPALLTEILPSVNEIFPERSSSEGQTRPPTLSSRSVPAAASTPGPGRSAFESSVAPALAPLTAAPDPAPAPAAFSPAPAPAKLVSAAPAFAPAPTAAPIITLTPTPAPLVSVADSEAHADPVLPSPAIAEPPASSKRKTAAIRRPTVRVKPKKDTAETAIQSAIPGGEEPDTALPASEASVDLEDSEDLAESFLLPDSPAPPPPNGKAKPASDAGAARLPESEDDDDDVAPFGFLLGDPPEQAAPSMSTLAEILKNAAAEVKSVSQPAATSAPSSLTATPAPPPSVPAIPSVLPEIDPALGMVYKITPPEKDDLTRIKGIASVLEKRLHDLGIYTWRQIASWEDSHVREFSTRLAFKDRIAREKWVEQARSLNEARHSA